MAKFHTDHRDSIPPAPIKRKLVHRTGIDPPPGRIGIYKDGQRTGHVGEHAGIGVVSRLLGGGSAEVGKVRGKTAWIATGPSRPSSTQKSMMKLRSQLRGDKGSVRK